MGFSFSETRDKDVCLLALENQNQWKYKLRIDLNEETPVNDFQVLLKFNTTLFNYSIADENGDDIRFMESGSVDFLPYWIEKWNDDGDSSIWINVETAGTKTLIMLFGNNEAESISNGDDTFIFFDDFNDGIYTDKWDIFGANGTYEESGGLIHIDGNWIGPGLGFGSLRAKKTIQAPFVVEWSARLNSGLVTTLSFANSSALFDAQIVNNRFDIRSAYDLGGPWPGKTLNCGINNGSMFHFRGTACNNTWKLERGMNLEEIYRSDTLTMDATIGNQSYEMVMIAHELQSSKSSWDFVRVRKHSDHNITATIVYNDFIENWRYSNNISLSNSTDVDQYQVLLEFNDNNFNYSRARNLGQDIRFYDHEMNKLPYWIEKWNDLGNTKIWIKVRNTGTTNITMYYGNQDASSQTNGSETFEFFDDFNDGIYTDKWYPENPSSLGKYEEQNGSLTLTAKWQTPGAGDAILKSYNSFQSPFISEWKYKIVSGNDVGIQFIENDTYPPNFVASANMGFYGDTWFLHGHEDFGGPWPGTTVNCGPSDFNWHEWRGIASNNSWHVYRGDELDQWDRDDWLNFTPNINNRTFHLRIFSQELLSTVGEWDFIRIRKYSDKNVEATLNETIITPIEPDPIVGGFFDGFESYLPDTYPNSWVKDANAHDLTNNYLDNDIAYNGSQSLKLFGQIGASWASISYHDLNCSSPYNIEMAIRNGNESIYGAHPHRGGFGIRSGTSWTNPERVIVYNHGNGTVTSGTGLYLGKYSVNVWYKWRIYYEILNATHVKIVYWVNDTYLNTEVSQLRPSELSMSNLQIWAQEGSVWYDDIRVTPGLVSFSNIKPTAEAGGPYYSKLGASIVFNGSKSFDLDDEKIFYRWDFDNDDIWDTEYSTNSTVSHNWESEYCGELKLEVYDGSEASIDTAVVSISNDVLIFLVNSKNEPIEGGVVSYYNKGWQSIGTTNTSGQLRASISSGSFSFRMNYLGGIKTIIQDIESDNGVIFKTVNVSIELKDSNDQYLSHGTAKFYAGGWKTIGETQDGIVSIELLPKSYTFRMIYLGGIVNIAQDVGSHKVVCFHTINVTIELKDSSDNYLDNGYVKFYSSGWKDIGHTSNGTVSIELLPKSYTFRMVYLDSAIDEVQNIVTDHCLTFQTNCVTVEARDHEGNLFDTSEIKFYSKGWKTIGNTYNGSISIELLSKSYTFRMSYLGTSDSITQNTMNNSTVVFRTGSVSSNSCTQYYAKGWKTFTNGLNLLPGTYTFRYSDGTTEQHSILAGVINNID